MKRSLVLLMGLLSLALAQPYRVTDATGKEVSVRSLERIVSLGGGVTELLFALGLGDRVVARDTSSYFPPAVLSRPDVGLFFRLNAEAILAQRPTVVFGAEGSGPPPVLAQLAAAGVPVVIVPEPSDVEGAKRKIRLLAQATGRTARGEEIVRGLERDLLALRSKLSLVQGKKPRTLYIYPRDPRNTFICGNEASGAALINLAGGVNAGGAIQAAAGLRGCAPISAEAVVAARPEVILVPFFPDQPVSLEAVLRLPGVAQTPAGQQGRVVAMEVLYLSTFGHRVGRAALDLHNALFERQGFVRISGQ